MWLGLFDIQLSQTWTNYNWQWADGSVVDFTNWRQGEPDSQGGQRCVSINGWADGIYQWDDSDCTIQMQAAVCQMDPS